MPAIWGLPPLTGSIEDDKAVRLSTGVTVDLSSFKFQLDKKPPQRKLDGAVARVQAAMDTFMLLADLPDDEPGKAKDLRSLDPSDSDYHKNMWHDGDQLRARSTRFSLTWENGRLRPFWGLVE